MRMLMDESLYPLKWFVFGKNIGRAWEKLRQVDHPPPWDLLKDSDVWIAATPARLRNLLITDPTMRHDYKSYVTAGKLHECTTTVKGEPRKWFWSTDASTLLGEGAIDSSVMQLIYAESAEVSPAEPVPPTFPIPEAMYAAARANAVPMILVGSGMEATVMSMPAYDGTGNWHIYQLTMYIGELEHKVFKYMPLSGVLG